MKTSVQILSYVLACVLIILVLACALLLVLQPYNLVSKSYYTPPKMFDAIYYINLEHRKDRRNEIEGELVKLNWLSLSTRIEANYKPTNGALGCLLSHISALQTFLHDPRGLRHALILEDDCMFEHDPRPNIELFFKEHGSHNWDVLMLASNTQSEKKYKPYATKILDAWAASAYAITREFALKLLHHWEQTVPVFRNPEKCCDVSWKELQPQSRWYCLKPKPAIQRPSFSDIEMRNVNYGV
jgi:glycosyl transferase family 25